MPTRHAPKPPPFRPEAMCPAAPSGNPPAQIARRQGDPAIPVCLARVVETLTQFPTVRRVVLTVDGQPVVTLGGDGLVVPPVLDQAKAACTGAR